VLTRRAQRCASQRKTGRGETDSKSLRRKKATHQKGGGETVPEKSSWSPPLSCAFKAQDTNRKRGKSRQEGGRGNGLTHKEIGYQKKIQLTGADAPNLGLGGKQRGTLPEKAALKRAKELYRQRNGKTRYRDNGQKTLEEKNGGRELSTNRDSSCSCSGPNKKTEKGGENGQKRLD